MPTNTKPSHYEWKLREEILARSNAGTWDKARLEWRVTFIEEVEECKTCLCTKYPIREVCHLKNTKNGERVHVGNVCVKKFLGLPSHLLFAALKRIKKDLNAAMNADLIELCFTRRIFGERDRNFYLDTWRKRTLTEPQYRYRRYLNYKAIDAMSQDHDLNEPPSPAS